MAEIILHVPRYLNDVESTQAYEANDILEVKSASDDPNLLGTNFYYKDSGWTFCLESENKLRRLIRKNSHNSKFEAPKAKTEESKKVSDGAFWIGFYAGFMLGIFLSLPVIYFFRILNG